MSDETRPMGFPPAGEDAPVQGTSSEDREAYGEYVRLEADPSDPLAGDEPGYIKRHTDK